MSNWGIILLFTHYLHFKSFLYVYTFQESSTAVGLDMILQTAFSVSYPSPYSSLLPTIPSSFPFSFLVSISFYLYMILQSILLCSKHLIIQKLTADARKDAMKGSTDLLLVGVKTGTASMKISVERPKDSTSSTQIFVHPYLLFLN